MLVTDSALSSSAVDGYLRRVYSAYSDFALKNPFYDIDMPLRCQLFEEQIDKIFAEYIKG